MLLKAVGIRKVFPDVVALDGVEFEVDRGRFTDSSARTALGSRR
jgi:ABC-type sugar transport system ATPase subunit